MSEWKVYKLGDACTELSDGLHKAPIFVEGGDYIFVNAKNIAKGFIVDNDPTKKSTKEEYLKYSSPLNETTILYSIDGTIGNIALYRGEKCILGKGACYMNPNPQILDRMYLYYTLQSPHFNAYIDQMSTGSTIQHISLKTMRNYVFTCPPLDEQKQIASVLSSLDDKIDLLNRENATLEAMAETLFHQWFIEEAKEDWKEGKLGDILSVKGGTTPSTKESRYWDGDIAWTSPRDITTLNGIYLFKTEKTITEAGLKQISSGLLPKGTLLMSSRAPVGVLAFAEIPLAINQGYIAILDDKGYAKEFIYLWLKANMDLVHSYSNGSTFMEISKSAFKSLDITIPSQKEVSDFVTMIKPYFDKIKLNEEQIILITKQRDILLPKLMSNEINI